MAAKRMGFRVLAIGDPHFKERNVEQTAGMVNAIVKIAETRRPDLIVCLGDVLDRHARLHTDPLCDAIEFFRRLKAIAPLRIIIGNHDRRNNSDFMTDRHPFTAIKDEWAGTMVADQVIDETLDGHHFVYVPYVPNGRFIEALQLGIDGDLTDMYDQERKDKAELPADSSLPIKIEVSSEELNYSLEEQSEEQSVDASPNEQLSSSDSSDTEDDSSKDDPTDDEIEKELALLAKTVASSWWADASIVFAHQEFYGAKMGHMISVKGDKLPLNHPFVVTGHIHDYQKPQANILYTGTPIQHSFGDTVDKTISLLTWDGTSWIEERIDLGLVRRKCFHLKPHELINWSPPPGYIVKVKVEGTPGELKTLKSLPLIEKLRERGVIVTIKTLPEKSTYTVGSSVRQTRTYLVNLFEQIEKQPHVDQMKTWYLDLFGRPEDMQLVVSSAGTSTNSSSIAPTIYDVIDSETDDSLPTAAYSSTKPSGRPVVRTRPTTATTRSSRTIARSTPAARSAPVARATPVAKSTPVARSTVITPRRTFRFRKPT